MYIFTLDDNECETGLSECDEHAECVNTLGSYECSCLDGFRGDGFECRGKYRLPSSGGKKIKF